MLIFRRVIQTTKGAFLRRCIGIRL